MEANESTEISGEQAILSPESPTVASQKSPAMKPNRLKFIEQHQVTASIVIALITLCGSFLLARYTAQNSLDHYEQLRAKESLLDTELDVQQTPFSSFGLREINIGVVLKNHGYGSIPLNSIRIVINEGKLTTEALNRLTKTTTPYPMNSEEDIRIFSVHRSSPDLSWTQVTETTDKANYILPVDGQTKYWFKFVLRSRLAEATHSPNSVSPDRMKWYHAQVEIKLNELDIRSYHYYFSHDSQTTYASETAQRIEIK